MTTTTAPRYDMTRSLQARDAILTDALNGVPGALDAMGSEPTVPATTLRMTYAFAVERPWRREIAVEILRYQQANAGHPLLDLLALIAEQRWDDDYMVDQWAAAVARMEVLTCECGIRFIPGRPSQTRCATTCKEA
jgi:hypothetical protein